MVTSIIEYWKEISGTVGAIVLFIAGRKSSKYLEKKQQADAIDTMQKTYNVFLEHYNKQHITIINQYNEVLDNNKKTTDRLNKLTEQFVSLQLNYAKEIETSQNWEKLHRKLEEQYKMLEKKYNILETQYKESEIRYKDLEKLYNKLKTDFENHKKQM